MTKKIAEGKTLGLKYEIYDNTGIVEHIEFSKDMLLTKASQENMVHLPNFVGVPQPKYHQHIRLQGNDTSINVAGPKVAEHNGEQLTLFLLTQDHGKSSTYLGSVNHSSKQTTDAPTSIREQLFPWTGLWISLVLGILIAFAFQMLHMERGTGTALVATALITPALFLSFYVVGWWISMIRTIAVRQNQEFKTYRQQLAQNPSLA